MRPACNLGNIRSAQRDGFARGRGSIADERVFAGLVGADVFRKAVLVKGVLISVHAMRC
jgi:hypothetical protein